MSYENSNITSEHEWTYLKEMLKINGNLNCNVLSDLDPEKLIFGHFSGFLGQHGADRNFFRAKYPYQLISKKILKNLILTIFRVFRAHPGWRQRTRKIFWPIFWFVPISFTFWQKISQIVNKLLKKIPKNPILAIFRVFWRPKWPPTEFFGPNPLYQLMHLSKIYFLTKNYQNR